MKLASWAATDQGRKRKNNEDHYRLSPELGLVAVADGMGGHAAGEVASAIAVDTVREVLLDQADVDETVLATTVDDPDDAIRERLRYAMNQAAVRFRKPLVECAMFELEGQLTVIEPGQTPCLRCLYPEPPASWKRRFPVFGAVSGSLGCMAAMEVIKLISGLGKPLRGQLLSMDLREPAFRRFRIRRDPACPVCCHLACGSDSSESAVLK